MFADVDTHLTWLRRFALRQTVYLFPFGGPLSVVIAVEDGLMAGTTTKLRGETLLIGAGGECDILLVDNGVAERHVSVRLRTSIFGTLAEVTALETTTISGELPLDPASAPRLMRLPVVLQLGGAKVRLSAPAATGFARNLNRKAAALVSLICVTSVGAFLAVNQLVRAAQIEHVAETVLVPPAPAAHSRADALSVSVAMLGELGLKDDVTVLAGEGESLVLSGQVPESRWTQWQDFRAWYDQQSHLPTLISSVTMAPKLVELRPIAAVQLHAPATVFFAVGQPAKVGDVIDQGWTLTAIDADGLTLERANATTRIRF
jgi:hypothetical protein